MGRFRGLPAELFDFYRGLAEDNSKAYWTAHRETYDGPIKESLTALAEELEPEFGAMKLYRPNRDVRFGTDKRPYRPHTGLYREVDADIFVYVNIDGDGMLIGAGLHTQNAQQTAALRQGVDDDAVGPGLVEIVTTLAGLGFDISGETVRTRPRGVAADHPRLDLMRHRDLNARRLHPPDERLRSRHALDVVRGDWHTLAPLNEWLSGQLAAAHRVAR